MEFKTLEEKFLYDYARLEDENLELKERIKELEKKLKPVYVCRSNGMDLYVDPVMAEQSGKIIRLPKGIDQSKYYQNYVIDYIRLYNLLEKEETLDKLKYAGVDNWEGYEQAFESEKAFDINKYIERNFQEWGNKND